MHMKVGVYVNAKYITKDEPYKIICEELKKQGIECVSVVELTVIKTLDILLVLGGDGTILNVASECALYEVKILGINCGHMGFLADFESNQLKDALNLIISGDYKTVKRSMLEVICGNSKYLALNEAVIQRCTSGNAFTNTVNLHAEIDGTTVDNFSSDGLIISTPTGSTAYSLSAGGSILTPDLNAFIMTPICPHSLHSRPIVFSDRATVCVNQTEKTSVLNLIVDGRVVETVDGNLPITIKKAVHCLNFIALDDNSFFEKLLIKLNIWSK